MLYPEGSMVNMMESSLAETMGVRSPVVGALSSEHGNNMANKLELANNMANMTKSNLDNIVGSLWQARQESSGSSRGDQSPRNGDDLSEGEAEPGSPEDNGNDMGQKDRDASEEQDIASDLRLPKGHPFNFPPLAGLPGLPALEALSKQKELLGGNIVLPSSSPQGLLKAPSNLFPSHHPGFPPLRPPSQPTSGSQSNSPSDFGTQQNWSFEEQFKQLYEIDDNPKRKEFLDELFAFMQKRGTPINRLPIMAKQVLDLYELYNLVVARGGLVEVINKKQWQEIIKGLGLPSSITSAAFTLRTQYTKYLYPWEMTTKNLSTQQDLQNAIDGNKREGRRIESFNMPPSSMPVSMPPLSMPPFGMPTMSPLSLSPKGKHSQNSPPGENFGALEMTRLALWKLYNQGQPGGMPPLMPALNMDMLANANHEKALNLAAVAAQDEKVRREKEVRAAREEEQKQREELRQREQEARERLVQKDNQQRMERDRELKERLEELNRGGESSSPPPAKRQCTSPPNSSAPMSTNLNMQSREEEDGRKSMEISMEINGIQYKGVLYARPS